MKKNFILNTNIGKMNQNIDQKISVLHERARELILEKRKDADIILELAKEGIEPGYAELIIENIKTDLSDKKEFRKELFKGICFTISGLLLNAISFIAFSNAGLFFWIV